MLSQLLDIKRRCPALKYDRVVVQLNHQIGDTSASAGQDMGGEFLAEIGGFHERHTTILITLPRLWAVLQSF